MITLTNNTYTVTLPDDILWQDEFSWHPVEQRVEPTITGAVIVQTAERLAGRPITLSSGADFAWLTRQQLDQLQVWASEPGQQLTLTIRAVAHTVIFAHDAGPALEAEMILYHSAPTSTDYYTVTMRLREI